MINCRVGAEEKVEETKREKKVGKVEKEQRRKVAETE